MEVGFPEGEIAIQQVALPKDIVTSEVKKTPDQLLSEAIKDQNKSAEDVLEVFENKYIPDIEDFDPNNFDVGILLYTKLPKRIVSDANFDPKITNIESPNDSRTDGFPELVKSHIELDQKGEWGHSQFKKLPEDPRWSRLWKLMGKYEQKIISIVRSKPDIVKNYSGTSDSDKTALFEDYFKNSISRQYERWINEVKEKGIGELVKSGEWIGSGTFISNLEKMLEYGGKIKSANHVLNSNQDREHIQGNIKGTEVHQSSIFFYHWRKENSPNGTDPVGYYGTQINGKDIYSDISVFYPVDTVYKNGLTIGTNLGSNSGSEFFVTKSPELWKRPSSLTPDQLGLLAKNDQTELPIDQAFFSVDDPNNYNKVKDLFIKFGYSEDWIKTHVYERLNGRYDRTGIRDWLDKRPYAKVDIPKMEPKVCYDGNAYIWEPVK